MWISYILSFAWIIKPTFVTTGYNFSIPHGYSLISSYVCIIEEINVNWSFQLEITQ